MMSDLELHIKICWKSYARERLAFIDLMEQLAANPPTGVDGAQWMACVHKL